MDSDTMEEWVNVHHETEQDSLVSKGSSVLSNVNDVKDESIEKKSSFVQDDDALERQDPTLPCMKENSITMPINNNANISTTNLNHLSEMLENTHFLDSNEPLTANKASLIIPGTLSESNVNDALLSDSYTSCSSLENASKTTPLATSILPTSSSPFPSSSSSSSSPSSSSSSSSYSSSSSSSASTSTSPSLSSSSCNAAVHFNMNTNINNDYTDTNTTSSPTHDEPLCSNGSSSPSSSSQSVPSLLGDIVGQLWTPTKHFTQRLGHVGVQAHANLKQEVHTWTEESWKPAMSSIQLKLNALEQRFQLDLQDLKQQCQSHLSNGIQSTAEFPSKLTEKIVESFYSTCGESEL